MKYRLIDKNEKEVARGEFKLKNPDDIGYVVYREGVYYVALAIEADDVQLFKERKLILL